jgi:DNA-binding NarL/FixJ family response regulator
LSSDDGAGNEAGLRPPGDARRKTRARAMISVALAEDNLLVREGLIQLLSTTEDIEIIAACETPEELLAAVRDASADVVLTDIRMPPSFTDEGLRLAAELRDQHPEVGVVVLTQYDDPAYALRLFEKGSDRRGYLLKERVHHRAQLDAAIRSVADGGSVVDPKIVDALVAAKSRAERSALADLTPREREVLAEIAQGKSNTAIAETLVLTKRAVEKHINAIFLKLDLAFAEDVSKRVKAALLFLSDSQERGGA